MAKKVAVLAVNPVNGCGLFQYLEAFFENGISYKVFAVSDTKEIKTNSGISLTVDDVIANLKGHEDEFDALVFSLVIPVKSNIIAPAQCPIIIFPLSPNVLMTCIKSTL